ncbi:PH domain-containing protein [Streptomyces anulatus]|uniref:PH domain-containing protein n=1 Tax=Streptomyces anulatus TaxID=1892 RepID=UPI001C27D1CA|nr:PH domain-containing protein [Streptomyces anulatus]
MDENLYQGELFLPDEQFTRLPRKVITLWRIEVAATAVLITSAIAAVFGLLMPWWLEWDRHWALIAAFAPLQAAWMWFRLKARWLFTGYRLADDDVLVRHGLLERCLETFAYGRIQLVEVSSGFWARRLGLAHVTISIGARDHAEIGPVSTEEAARLRSELMELTGQTAVEL